MKTKAYFVSKVHDATKAMVELLTDRLDDTGWELMLRLTSFSYLYNGGELTHCLQSNLLEQGLCSSSYWTVNGKEITAQQYLKLEASLSAKQSVLSEAYSVREQKYRLAGTAESITIVSAESGVYLYATASQETHDMLSEYYTLAEDPATLYSATDEDGMLWEMTELFSEDME